jgi:hypothetical protein
MEPVCSAERSLISRDVVDEREHEQKKNLNSNKEEMLKRRKQTKRDKKYFAIIWAIIKRFT